MWPIVLLVVVLAVAYVIAVRQGLLPGPGPATDDDQGGKMSASRRRFVTVYLIILGVFFVFMEVSLLQLDFPETPLIEPAIIQVPTSQSQQVDQPAPTGEATAQASPAPQSSPTPIPQPVIEYVLPQSTIGNTPHMWLAIYGKNFSPKAKIRLNGHTGAISVLSSNLLAAQLSQNELLNVGSLTIDVVDDGRISNARIVQVKKPRVPLKIFPLNVVSSWEPHINRELQLLLLVCFAGALGSYIHALKSATAYIGNRNMGGSWFWWYMSGPFIGMAMSLIFYAVLRGGFLAGTPADERVVNPFGVVAVGALVGMFADKAALKLGEIFETLFKSGDPRSDKLDAPSISSLDPSKLLAGKATQTVIIKGKRLGKVSMVRFNSTEVKPDFVSDDEVHFKLGQKDLAVPRVLNISAIDPQAGASVSAKLPIVGPKIASPNGLPPATVNTQYQEDIGATDGTTPYQWSVEGPDWLTIDANGRLAGTPPAVGEFQVTVTVKDTDGASAQKAYTLTVT